MPERKSRTGPGMKRKRGNTWTLTIELPRDVVTGKRRQKHETFRGTSRQADDRLTHLLAERNRGLSVATDKTLMADYLKSWLATYAEGAVAPTTYRRYEGLIRTHIVPVIGTIPMQRFEPLHVQRIYIVMGEKKLAARTIIQAHRVLRQALQHALRWQLVVRNVADVATLPRPEKFKPMVIDADRLRIVLTEADDTPYATFFFLAAATGLRQSELCGLAWASVDLGRSTLTVEQSCHWIPRQGFIFRQPKTTTSIRTIALSTDTVQRLREHRHEQLQARLAAGPTYQGDLVLADGVGGPLHPSNIRDAWRGIVKKAEVVGLRVHDLRHAHASLLLRQGVSMKAISERLGHSSISVTADLYAHLTGNMEQEAANAFDRALTNG